MLYTIGDPLVYDEILENNPNGLRKLGRSEDYIGGIVYTDIKEAIDNKHGYDVYILDTNMANVYIINDSYHLIDTCSILKKYKNQY